MTRRPATARTLRAEGEASRRARPSPSKGSPVGGRPGAPPRGRVITDYIQSRCLRGNLPGDPALREVTVYLPPGYDDSSRRRYPVLLVLTGFTGSGWMFANRPPFGESLPERMDRLIATGRARPAILVMPDCCTRYGGSQYINSGATGRYEDHVTGELIPWIDARYRTVAERSGRGVVGKSSGGYGALVLGMRHPDLFGAVASHSGDMYFEYCYLPDVPKAADILARHGGLTRFLQAFRAAPKKRPEMFTALNIVAMAACYSPNRRAELGIDLPFELPGGRFREVVWRRWLEHDPVRLLPRHREALRGLRLLFIDCGSRDEWNLHLGARIFRQELQRSGIRHVYQEFEDGHMDIPYRFDESLPRLTRALSTR